MQLDRYVVKYAFQGDTVANQLSLQAGDVVVADMNQQSQGWVWGSLVRNSENGWCPLSYLVPETTQQQRAPPPSTIAPPTPGHEGAPLWVFDDGCEDGGFSGPIMGGTAVPSTPHMSYQQNTQQQSNRSVREAFSGIGSSMRSVGSKSVTIISKGARKGAEFTQKTAEETKYRVQDMAGGQNKHGTPVAVAKPVNKNGRTDGEQRKLDVGNGAAAGAVVLGAYGAVSGGGVNAIKRGVITGATMGGAHGFVKNWKPFG